MNSTEFPSKPFPGLRAFRQEEDYLFFGREEQTNQLLARLNEKRFLAVVGTSGSGKSSLVRAGLLPALQGGRLPGTGSDWEILVMHPGVEPIVNLARVFIDSGLHEKDPDHGLDPVLVTLKRSGLGLVEAVKSSNLERETNLLIVIDQFEELFRYREKGTGEEEEAALFVELLLEGVRQTSRRIFVCITMRSDYLGDCAQFRGLPELINQAEYLVPRLTRQQRKAAIEGPIKVCGAQMTPRLLQTLLNDVGDDPDQLPILQHALMRTWEKWLSQGLPEEPLDLPHYQSMGRMAKALSLHADEVYSNLADDAARRLAERLFRSLTERGADNRGIRRPTRVQTLLDILEASFEELLPVLDAFRASGVTFLMPECPKSVDRETMVDISHESLMRVWRRLNRWVEEEAQSIRTYRRLVDTANLHRQGRAGHYHDPDLQIALSWKAANKPNAAWADRNGGDFELAMQFLEESRLQNERRIRELEERRQRELQQAHDLAEAQRLRAEEHQRSAMKLYARGQELQQLQAQERMLSKKAARTWKALLVFALLLSGLFVYSTYYFYGKAKQNAEEASVQRRLVEISSRESRLQRDLARKNLETSDEHRMRAEAIQRRLNESVYLADMMQLSQAYADGNVQWAVALLDRHNSESHEPVYQGLEWAFWKGVLRGKDPAVPERFGFRLPVQPDALSHGVGDSVFFMNRDGVAEPQSIRFVSISDGSVANWNPDALYLAWKASNNGAYAAGLNSADGMEVWDLDRDQVIHGLSLDPNDARVARIAVSNDGKRVALSMRDDRIGNETLLISQLDNGGLKPIIHSQSPSPVSDIGFSSDSRILGVHRADSSIEFLDLLTETSLRIPPENSIKETIIAPVFSPAHPLVALGMRDRTIQLIDLDLDPAAFDVVELGGHAGSVQSVAFSMDGRFVLSGDEKGVLRIWDVGTGTLRSRIQAHTGPIDSILLDGGGSWMATFSRNGQRLKIWSLSEAF